MALALVLVLVLVLVLLLVLVLVLALLLVRNLPRTTHVILAWTREVGLDPDSMYPFQKKTRFVITGLWKHISSESIPGRKKWESLSSEKHPL